MCVLLDTHGEELAMSGINADAVCKKAAYLISKARTIENIRFQLEHRAELKITQNDHFERNNWSPIYFDYL